MYKTCDKLLDRKDFESAYEIVEKSNLNVRRTPCLQIRSDSDEDEVCKLFSDLKNFNQQGWSKVFLKCENLQNTGSFKLRGVSTQFAAALREFSGLSQKKCGELELVTMSAGNYGRSYAYAAQSLGLPATVLMPDTAPANRAEMLRNYGLQVEKMPSALLMDGVKKHETNGKLFMHPFDDINLIAGHGSLGMEILKDVPDADAIAVCCGGGGLLAGVAAAVKLCKPSCKVYGVEPETACSMQRSLEEGQAVKMPTARSVAAGLAPPFAGENAFQHAKEFVDEVFTVSEEEIEIATRAAFNNGLVVEPSGAAALAAFMHNKFKKEVQERNFVIVLTGGNVSPDELHDMFK